MTAGAETVPTVVKTVSWTNISVMKNIDKKKFKMGWGGGGFNRGEAGRFLSAVISPVSASLDYYNTVPLKVTRAAVRQIST